MTTDTESNDDRDSHDTSNTSNPGSNAERLMDEAVRLVKKFGNHREEILSTGLDVISLLGEGIGGSNPRTSKTFSGVLDSDHSVRDLIVSLLDKAHKIIVRYQNDNFEERIMEFLELNARLDATK